MIVNEKEALTRLNSPLNLMNRMKSLSSSKNNAMSLFGVGRNDQKTEQTKTVDIKAVSRIEPNEVKVSFNPFEKQSSRPTSTIQSIIPTTAPQVPTEETTKLDDILENHESQIKLGLAHDKALDLLVNSVNKLTAKLDDVKADKLPSVITAASKTVESIRKERNEAMKNGKDKEVHLHFYTPKQSTLSDYKIIDVGGQTNP